MLFKRIYNLQSNCIFSKSHRKHLIININIYNISPIFYLVVKEVDERKEFLQQMKDIGKGDKYQTIIDTEISQVHIKQIYEI